MARGTGYSPSLNPAQIPANPPKALRKIEEKDNMSEPQMAGIKLPTVEPTKSPIQTNVFLLIVRLYQRF
jgi:hypothetical protein